MPEPPGHGPVIEEGASPSRKDAIASLAGQLRRASPGVLARLRRFHPEQDGRSALFEAEWMLKAADVQTRSTDERRRWGVLLHCLAIARGHHESSLESEPGWVLARLRVSEARVKQLVEAEGEVLADLLPRLARRVAAAGATLNWWPLAILLLYTEEPRADEARRRIVSAYLDALGRLAAEAVPAA